MGIIEQPEQPAAELFNGVELKNFDLVLNRSQVAIPDDIMLCAQTTLGRTKLFNPNIPELVEHIAEKKELQEWLQELHTCDADTHLHSYRVALISCDLAWENEVKPEHLAFLAAAALLHDIGKLNTPLHILTKSGGLSDAEFNVLMQHARDNFLMLSDPKFYVVRRIAVGTHEYNHRHSYPRSLTEASLLPANNTEQRSPLPEVELLSPIVAVSDMYDALASSRSYKDPLDKGTIARILREDFVMEDTELAKKYIRQLLSRGSD